MNAARFRPPAGAVDCHAHVFGPFARFPLAEGRTYTPAEAPFGAYAAMLSRVGLDRAVLVQGSPHGRDNAVLLDALARAPQRLRGIAVVDPAIGDAELGRLAKAGVRGIRMSDALHPGTPLASMEALAARLAPLGGHIQVYLPQCSDLIALAPRIRASPVPVVVDHLAGVTPRDGLDAPGFCVLLDLLTSTDHVWTKLASFYGRSSAGSPYDDMAPYARAVAAARSDRLVFGTNWPHPGRKHPRPDDADLLDAFARWFPQRALQQRILVDNPERLFRFPPFNPASHPSS
jgi:predicted TIM-barrel fold metal-dependent hydrolase